jgi:hypothetical protein
MPPAEMPAPAAPPPTATKTPNEDEESEEFQIIRNEEEDGYY